MDGYDVVFDVARAGYTTWWFPLVGAAMFLLMLAGGRIATRLGVARLDVRFAWGIAVFGVAWTTIAFVGTYRDYRRLSTEARSGAAVLVEGRVESVEPQPPPADEEERLVVAGHLFTYSDAEVTAAFNLTRRTGGPLRAGQWVRVWHLDGKIVRIAIKRGIAGQRPPHDP